LGATSKSAHLFAAFSFWTVVTFYHKGSRNEHHWICLVKLKAEKKILVSFMVSKGEKNFKKDVITVQLMFAVFVCLYEINSFLSCGY